MSTSFSPPIPLPQPKILLLEVWILLFKVFPDGSHPHPRRAPASPEKPHGRHPEGKTHGHHRTVGFGKILARVRHALRRGPAPICGVAFRVCPPVPRAVGKAGCRFHRGTQSRHCHRATRRRPFPKIHRRLRHGDLRLPPHPLGRRRCPARSRNGESHDPHGALGNHRRTLRPTRRLQAHHPRRRPRRGNRGARAPARRSPAAGLHPHPSQRRDQGNHRCHFR